MIAASEVIVRVMTAVLLVAVGCTPSAPASLDAALPDAPPPDAAWPDAAPPYDCENLPSGPFTLTEVPGAVASEDLAFDAGGNLVGSDDYTIYRSPFGGPPQVWVANIEFRAGMRFLPSGHLVIADNNQGALIRIDETGARHTVLAGLSYPNGLTVGMDGMVYVTEHDAYQIRRVNPMTGEYKIIVDSILNPNGIAFDPTYKKLYFAGFSGRRRVYQMPIDASGNTGEITILRDDVGSGLLDGIAVDACGNVYVCDYGQNGDSQILRISPDGSKMEVLVARSGNQEPIYLPNLDWGSGIGGWDPMTLYIPDGWDHKVYAVDVGVPSKPRVYP